jgi:hypothetical protein
MSKWTLPHPQILVAANGNEVRITMHAMKQFYKRYLKKKEGKLSQAQKDSVEFFYNKFKKHFIKSIEMKRKNSVSQIIRHNFQPARYFVSRGWVFVTDERAKTILTCYARDYYKDIFEPCLPSK